MHRCTVTVTIFDRMQVLRVYLNNSMFLCRPTMQERVIPLFVYKL